MSVSDRASRFAQRARRSGVPTAVLAVVDGAVAGVACLIECDLDSHAHLSPWVASVLVLPAYRGHGIGSALSERIARDARTLGFSRAYLFTFDKQAFYRRLGWLPIDDAAFAGRPVTVMVRELAAESHRT